MANTRSRYADDALQVMGDTLRAARIEQRIAQHDLAERAGISRALLVRIERGDPGCAIGSVFEVAAVLRVPLFGLDDRDLRREATRLADRRALLPASVRRPAPPSMTTSDDRRGIRLGLASGSRRAGRRRPAVR